MISAKTTIPCRLCGSKEYKTLLKDIETFIDEKYSLKQCLACTFITVFPLPDSDSRDRYYTSNYWRTSPQGDFDIFHKFFAFRTLPVLRDLRKILPKGKRLLDWGSGDGAWLKVVRQAGYEGWGVDQYQTNPKDEFIKNGDIDSAEIPNEYFDIVTCFHVLEHIHDPMSNFMTALRKLKPGGIMFIEVPNIDSFGFRFFKKKWQPLEIPTHLNHFSFKTLNRLILSYEKSQIISASFFSLRASPAAIVLSIFPELHPRLIREVKIGQRSFILKVVYLFLQVLFLPVSAVAAFCKKGCIMQFILKKTDVKHTC